MMQQNDPIKQERIDFEDEARAAAEVLFARATQNTRTSLFFLLSSVLSRKQCAQMQISIYAYVHICICIHIYT